MARISKRHQSEIIMSIGGLIAGYGMIAFARDYSTRNQAKRIAVKKAKEESKETATMLKFEIVNECLCGEKVKPWERQELVFSSRHKKWFRACEKCINDRAFWNDTENPGEIIEITKEKNETANSESHSNRTTS